MPLGRPESLLGLRGERAALMAGISNAMPLSIADAAATELQRLFYPHCDRCMIAGSIRRRAQVCNDIELVVVPKIGCDAADDVAISMPVDRLATFCEIIGRGDHNLIRRPVAAPGKRAPAWGDRYKKLVFFHFGSWRLVDLWISDVARFGSTLAIRTGDAEFSRLLVTKRGFNGHGGAMPEGIRQANGQLERVAQQRSGEPQWVPIATPEESDFFTALGLPLLNPTVRTEANLRSLLQQRRDDCGSEAGQ